MVLGRVKVRLFYKLFTFFKALKYNFKKFQEVSEVLKTLFIFLFSQCFANNDLGLQYFNFRRCWYFGLARGTELKPAKKIIWRIVIQSQKSMTSAYLSSFCIFSTFILISFFLFHNSLSIRVNSFERIMKIDWASTHRGNWLPINPYCKCLTLFIPKKKYEKKKTQFACIFFIYLWSN